MGCIAENRPPVVLHTRARSVKNAIIQFNTEDGKSRALSLDNITFLVCFTISKAYRKSQLINNGHMNYFLALTLHDA